MNGNRRQILQMLAEGKINADEAERLISACEQPSSAASSDSGATQSGKPRPKFLRVQVDAMEDEGHGGPKKVNVRVPIQLLRAGVKLAGLVPPQALEKANQELQKKGIPLDLSQIKPDNLEELVEHLSDLTVDVDSNEGHEKVKVRVFCE